MIRQRFWYPTYNSIISPLIFIIKITCKFRYIHIHESSFKKSICMIFMDILMKLFYPQELKNITIIFFHVYLYLFSQASPYNNIFKHNIFHAATFKYNFRHFQNNSFYIFLVCTNLRNISYNHQKHFKNNIYIYIYIYILSLIFSYHFWYNVCILHFDLTASDLFPQFQFWPSPIENSDEYASSQSRSLLAVPYRGLPNSQPNSLWMGCA